MTKNAYIVTLRVEPAGNPPQMTFKAVEREVLDAIAAGGRSGPGTLFPDASVTVRSVDMDVYTEQAVAPGLVVDEDQTPPEVKTEE